MTLNSKTLVALLTTTALAFATTANAQDDGWSGEASLSGSKTTGNTETTDLGLGLNLKKQGENWGHTFRASADFGRVSGETNKERYLLGYQIDRNFTDRLYAFGAGDYYRDEFGAFEEVSFYNNSEVTYSKSNTYLWNETGLTANLMGNLAARASFRVDHKTIHAGFLP